MLDMSADSGNLYAEVEMEGRGKLDCYENVRVAASHIEASSSDRSKQNSRSGVWLTVLWLVVTVFVAGAVGACIAFALKIAEHGQEIASLKRAS